MNITRENAVRVIFAALNALASAHTLQRPTQFSKKTWDRVTGKYIKLRDGRRKSRFFRRQRR